MEEHLTCERCGGPIEGEHLTVLGDMARAVDDAHYHIECWNEQHPVDPAPEVAPHG